MSNEKPDFNQIEFEEDISEKAKRYFPFVTEINEKTIDAVKIVDEELKELKGIEFKVVKFPRPNTEVFDYYIGAENPKSNSARKIINFSEHYAAPFNYLDNGENFRQGKTPNHDIVKEKFFNKAKNIPRFLSLLHAPELTDIQGANQEELSDIAISTLLTILYYNTLTKEISPKDYSEEEIDQACLFVHEILTAYKPIKRKRRALNDLSIGLPGSAILPLTSMPLVFDVWKQNPKKPMADITLEMQEKLAEKNKTEIEKRHQELLGNKLGEVILSNRDTSQSTDFTMGYEQTKENSKSLDFFGNILKGKPVIDLACGMAPDRVVILASISGASSWTGVDKYHMGNKTHICENGFVENEVCDDMLHYIVDQPDNSANIVLNGVDRSILNSEEYISDLIMEISRVVLPGGVAMGYNSPFLSKLSDYGFNQIKVPSEKQSFMSLELWQKPEISPENK